jgi:asparagine synthase (glutamine-hydrolysing)
VCGIAGIYSFNHSKDFLNIYVDKMCQSMDHRGPDDKGRNVLSLPGGWFCALGHRRLSILDTSKAGRQPMTNEDKSKWIIHNGEVYNFQEIRKELESLGYRFKSGTDTEVILKAYDAWDTDCVKRFNGMWSFAIVDISNGRLLISRDRLGIKPLYFTWVENTLLFASEIKAFFEFPDVPRELNLLGLSDYLSYRYVLGVDSLYKRIQSLLPGHNLCIESGEAKANQYWELPILPTKNDPGEKEVIEQTADLFKKSVIYRMISDVPLGAYLSGGIDSSAVVAEMAKISSHPVKTFTIGFEEDGFNEFAHARKVSDYFKTDHHEILLQKEDYLNLLPEVIGNKDAPLSVPNEVAVYVLSEELKKYITVVLSGEGADELFGGYGRIFRSALDFKKIEALRNGTSTLSSEEANKLNENLRNRYNDMDYGSPLIHFLKQYSYIPNAEKKALLNMEVLKLVGQDILNLTYFESYFNKLEGLDLHEKYIWLFQKIHLLGLLHRLDANTMAYAVEGRVPFVDHDFVEYVNALPLHYKIRWKSSTSEEETKLLNCNQISETHDIPKYLLRELFRKKLPPMVIKRKKLGFPVPVSQWFKDRKINELTREMLLSPNSRSRSIFERSTLESWLDSSAPKSVSRHGLVLWMLLNIEIWMRRYKITV